jgi:membrane protein
MWCVFAILYKLGPDRKGNKWRYVAVGALVGAILFELLKYGFTFYVSAFGAADSYQKSYGALGGILLFLFYIWLSAAVMLFGAEVASVVGGWKSVLEGPAAQQDPGARVPAEKLDSPSGPEVTSQEKARGANKPRPATVLEGKEAAAASGKTGREKTATEKAAGEIEKGKEKAGAKSPQPIPAYAISTDHYPTQADRKNPVTFFVGIVALGLAGLAGIIFRRKDPVG